ncbi:MAG: STAS domain-containing protein, partial [Eubacterium sp.]|nr:STAS domain-containing protein [Eubacterium sp.]
MDLFSFIEKDKIIVFLPERVNEQNATGVKNDLLSIISSHDNLIPVINCKNLTYISSSGLRGLLIVQQEYKKDKITLNNVGKDVYEILEMTGVV